MFDSRLNSRAKLRGNMDPVVIRGERAAVAKREMDEERVVIEAKTARLRALRLERDAAEKVGAKLAASAASSPDTPLKSKA